MEEIKNGNFVCIACDEEKQKIVQTGKACQVEIGDYTNNSIAEIPVMDSKNNPVVLPNKERNEILANLNRRPTELAKNIRKERAEEGQSR